MTRRRRIPLASRAELHAHPIIELVIDAAHDLKRALIHRTLSQIYVNGYRAAQRDARVRRK